MTMSLAFLIGGGAAVLLIGAVLVVFLRNNSKVVPPRELDENGAPMAKDVSHTTQSD